MTRARTGEEGSEGGGTIAPDGRRIIVVVIYVDARESKYYKRHYGRVSLSLSLSLSLSVFLFARTLPQILRYPFNLLFLR